MRWFDGETKIKKIIKNYLENTVYIFKEIAIVEYFIQKIVDSQFM